MVRKARFPLRVKTSKARNAQLGETPFKRSGPGMPRNPMTTSEPTWKQTLRAS
jgi:hypothetical protein